MIYVFVYTCLFLHSEYASVLFIRMLCAHCVDLSSSHELQPIYDISARWLDQRYFVAFLFADATDINPSTKDEIRVLSF